MSRRCAHIQRFRFKRRSVDKAIFANRIDRYGIVGGSYRSIPVFYRDWGLEQSRAHPKTIVKGLQTLLAKLDVPATFDALRDPSGSPPRKTPVADERDRAAVKRCGPRNPAGIGAGRPSELR